LEHETIFPLSLEIDNKLAQRAHAAAMPTK
jgi:hypothetical protein